MQINAVMQTWTGETVNEELAEGGIVYMVAVVEGASLLYPPSSLLALYLEAGAYLICRLFFFFKKCQD